MTVRKIAIVNAVFIALFLSRSGVGRLAQRGVARKEDSRLEMSTCRHVAFFAVLVDIEPLPLDFRCDAQAD